MFEYYGVPNIAERLCYFKEGSIGELTSEVVFVPL